MNDAEKYFALNPNRKYSNEELVAMEDKAAAQMNKELKKEIREHMKDDMFKDEVVEKALRDETPWYMRIIEKILA